MTCARTCAILFLPPLLFFARFCQVVLFPYLFFSSATLLVHLIVCHCRCRTATGRIELLASGAAVWVDEKNQTEQMSHPPRPRTGRGLHVGWWWRRSRWERDRLATGINRRYTIGQIRERVWLSLLLPPSKNKCNAVLYFYIQRLIIRLI